MFLGLIIIIIGFVFLLENLGFISGSVWHIIWPCLLIALGLSLICRKKRHEKRWEKFGEGMKKFGKEMRENFKEEE